MRVYAQLEGGTVRVSVMNACGSSECRNSSGVGMSIHGQRPSPPPGMGGSPHNTILIRLPYMEVSFEVI